MKTTLAKLITGEIVVAKYKDSNPEFLEDTFVVNFEPNPDGRIEIQLFPYMYPFIKVGVSIDISKVVYRDDCPKELEDAYIQVTSGIVIPKKTSSNLKLV